MKYIQSTILSLLLMASVVSYSQVTIGKNIVEGTKTIIDFQPNTGKGLILPWVTSLPTGTALQPGTLILDATTATAAKIKVYKDATSGWVDLSVQGGTVDLTEQNTLTEKGEGVIISDKPTPSPRGTGVLTLDTDSKGLILPKVTDYKTVLSPVAGTVVYDTTINMICFYSGSKWSFWY